MSKLIYSFIFVLFLLSSCKQDVYKPSYMGYEYFPNNVGHWVHYDVDSIVTDAPVSRNDTYRFQVKEFIESDFTDNSGRNAQRLERYYRDNDSADWYIRRVWYSNRTTLTAEKIEENVRYIKLHFPVTQDKEWNGNLYNFQPQRNYRFTAINNPYSINNFNFDSTVTVLQIDSDNVVYHEKVVEVYAKHIGLIYKSSDSLSFNSVDGSVIVSWKYEYKIRDYHY